MQEHFVLIPTKLDKIAKQSLEQAGFTVAMEPDAKFSELASKYPQTTVMVVRSEKVTAEVIDLFPALRLIVRAGAGYDTIDIKYARKKNIDVMNTPGANSNAVAEEVIAMVLAIMRHIVQGDTTTRMGQWEKNKLMGRELTGKTVGIVGMGNIGQQLVKRLRGFENRILAYDPLLTPSRAEELGVKCCELSELFAQSDVVSLHIPENEHTRGMINRTLLEKMKEGSILINCARAGIICEEDLRSVKQTKKIFFATDVYPKDEPGIKSVTDIADLMLPHIGANTFEANTNAAKQAAQQIIDYIIRGIKQNIVNRPVPPELDELYLKLAFLISRLAYQYLDRQAVTSIEASFYGGLDRFSEYLLPPIVMGLSGEFDPFFDFNEAQMFLEEKGIQFKKRQTDETKGYGKSLTIDLICGTGNNYQRCSIRGSVTESRCMISRIDTFDKLYFDPIGYSLIAVYEDRPGVLAKITSILSRYGYNIEDLRAPHDLEGKNSMAILLLNKPVLPEIIPQVQKAIRAQKVVATEILT